MTPVDAVTGSEYRDRVAIRTEVRVVEGIRRLAIDADRNVISDIARHVIQLRGFPDRQHSLHAHQVIDDFHASLSRYVLAARMDNDFVESAKMCDPILNTTLPLLGG